MTDHPDPPRSQDVSNETEGRSPWWFILREFLQNRRAVISLVLLVIIGASTIFVPMISPHSYSETFYHYGGASPPDAYHWFGIDNSYRDG